ncbi:cell adhesion molecule CEACAM5-like [Littorina saxatilis]|uniref:cell adhesion molecule CEACAM5-like n=1 Tax=Littorina saxatilis TaxID=31220 RepID=UPI0038B53542
MLGSQATLRCTTTSSGNFSWEKGGTTTLRTTTQDLTFTSLASPDLDSYTCAVEESGVTSVKSDAYALSATAAPSKPNVTYTPSSFEVGVRVDITCSVTPTDPTYTYSWTKDSVAISGQSGHTITYTAFGVSDFGDFACTVHHGSLTSPASDAVNVAAQYAPLSLTISHTSVVPSINVVQDEPLSVTCDATCLPSCTFTWTKNEVTSPVSSTSQLTLASVGTDDEGTYVCTATNSKGSNTVYFELVVDAVPSTPAFSVQPSSFTLGDKVNVTCLSTSTGSSLSYQWQRDGVVLSETSSQLTISSFDNSNSGSYTCKAKTTSLESVDSAALDLVPSNAPAKPSVTFTPSTPILGDQVNLTCASTGTHRWFKDGVLIQGQPSQSYIIGSVAVSDTAAYSCDVTNTLSVRSLKSDTVFMQPLYGPADGGMFLTYDSTNVSLTAQSISYISGSLLKVACIADCNPACNYTWHKSPDTSTYLSTSANLTLSNLQLADEGSYFCSANNTQGSSSFSFSLLVTAGPDSGATTVTLSAIPALLLLFTIMYIQA